MTDPVPSKNLVSRLRAVSRSASKWAIVSKQVEDPEYKTIYELITKVADESADEIERLRTTLRGISTCSTCEACRGAALRALGERTVEEINAAVDERLDRVERELAQPASRLCERCDSAIKNHECGCAKCGCTQCRLAQPPGDG